MATAIELLTQRQHEDWIRGWDDQGKLRPELTAQSIATAALGLRDWLVQQDWSWCNTDRSWDGDLEPSQASAGQNPGIAFPTKQQAILVSPRPALDRSDHLISKPVVLLVISDPTQFLIWFSATSSLGYPLFLGNPTWGLDHWQQVQEGLAPHLVITDPDWQIPPYFPWLPQPVDNSLLLWEKQDSPQVFIACGKQIDPNDHQGLSHLSPTLGFPQPVENPWIGIPTGGSSGKLRFALHSWKTLTASVSGLQQSGLVHPTGVINSCCMLPLHHVSGLMQFLRSLLSGGRFWLLPWPLVKNKFQRRNASSIGNQVDTAFSEVFFSSDLEQFFLSLVPTQLQHLLKESQGSEWLVRFYTIFLGGAPAWPALLDQAKSAYIRLAPTYGMTETASQIITLHPDDFLKGQLGCGKLLPHAWIDWQSFSDKANDNLCPDGQFQPQTAASGILKIRAHSLALGYYAIEPQQNQASGYGGSIELWTGNDGIEESARSLVTDDLGYCDPDGYFYIIGRASDKIISGGENVFPAAVEAGILATGLVKDAVVVGLADSRWGERVVAVVVPGEAVADVVGEAAVPRAKPLRAQLEQAIASTLTPAQRPKQWLFTDAIPRNAQGKIQRRQLRDWAMAQGEGNSGLWD